MAENVGWEQSRAILNDPKYRVLYQVLGWTALVLIGVLIGREIYRTAPGDHVWDYGINVFTSALSTVFTVTVIEIFNRKRAEDELKRQLKDDAASIVNDVANNAVHQMRRKGWLEGDDGLLKGADLMGADLHGVDLFDVNLREAVL